MCLQAMFIRRDLSETSRASVECDKRPEEEMPDQREVVQELTRAVLATVPQNAREQVSAVVYDASRYGDFGEYHCGKFSLHVVYRGVAYLGVDEVTSFCLRVWAALPESTQEMIDTSVWRKRGRAAWEKYFGEVNE